MAKAACYLGMAAGDAVLNDRGGIDIIVKNNGKALFDIFFRYALKYLAAPGIELQGDIGLIELRCRSAPVRSPAGRR